MGECGLQNKLDIFTLVEMSKVAWEGAVDTGWKGLREDVGRQFPPEVTHPFQGAG